jgi:hypothetical protein
MSLTTDRNSPCLREIQADGQQACYLILSEEERAKGFIRPVRRTYLHVGKNPVMNDGVLIKAGEGGCGRRTTMGEAIAETFARDPKFYGGTFCVTCEKHFPLTNADGSAAFVWETDNTPVGS